MTKRSRKLTALFFLVTLSVETLWPSFAWAVTSGPAQPEMQKFEPAGTADVVDLFTGDMKYNIPLMDVGGYPLNLSYASGTGMDEEASWVGAGWNLNPGAVTRTLRGLPDDFNGTINPGNNQGNYVTKEYKRKEFKKVGGKFVIKPTIFGWEIGKFASFEVGVYKDNYYGIGTEIGASLGFKQALGKRTFLTAGLDLNSDNRAGVTIRPSLSLSLFRDDAADNLLGSMSGSFAYNTRAGLKHATLGVTYAPMIQKKAFPISVAANWYFGQTYTPTLNNNIRNDSWNFSFDAGITAWGVYGGMGGEGYFTKENIADQVTHSPAFGYIHYLDGRNKNDVLLDYNREKDGTFIPGAPSIAIPVPTQDNFNVTSQTGAYQFRPFYGGNYIVHDRPFWNQSTSVKLGLTYGVGWVKKLGGRIDVTDADAHTGKWTIGNDFLQKGEAAWSNNPEEDRMYSKRAGELTASDENLFSKFMMDKTTQVQMEREGRLVKTKNALKSRLNIVRGQTPVSNIHPIATNLKKTQRETRTTNWGYLNARQASKYALEKKINYSAYNANTEKYEPQSVDRENFDRKADHISEMTVTDNEGKRLVYGIPVYNMYQQEANFSVAPPATPAASEKARRTGQITYTPDIDNSLSNQQGRDNLYTSESLPPYATSWLLTGILSSDYVDRTGDGISDDDFGTAFKFSYKKLASAVNAGDFRYKWRAPYTANTANYNEGFISDPKDDKANYAYGEKEIWYLDTLKGNKMIAIFYTSKREDGLGVNNKNGGRNLNFRLHKLDSIQLFTDAEYKKPVETRVPIKTAHFEYDYSLNPNMPNNTGNCVDIEGNPVSNCALPEDAAGGNVNKSKGKLTLKKVYFTFAYNKRGKSNPYVFHYDTRPLSAMNIANLPVIPSNDDEATENYLDRQTDRWGTYKKSFFNRQKAGGTDRKHNNSEYPYTLQPDAQAGYDVRKLSDWFASLWQLNKIETPTGSIINIEYEADDYAFVQDRRAMRMMNVSGIKVGNTTITDVASTEGMTQASGLIVDLPKNVGSISEFRDNYLRGADGEYLDKIFYRVNTDLNNRGKEEYVQGHAAIDPNVSKFQLLSPSRVFIPLTPVHGVSPMTFAAWQMLKSDLPHFAYDNYDNSDATNFSDDFAAAIKSLIRSVLNVGDLFTTFEEKATHRKFCNKINLSKSTVRLYCHPELSKVGGGARVKLVTISDEWNTMNSNAVKTVTGLVYSYTTKEGTKIISSGVASYEPQNGNEENPFREPVNFTEKVHWSTDRYHYIERPFGETFFPAPQIGYSKVTVATVGEDWLQNKSDDLRHTGFIENEFYTAREFPILTDNLTLDNKKYENNLIARLFTCTAITRVANSQGVKVELNDMHGKQKSVAVFNKGGDKISSTEYFYKTVDERANRKELSNTVQVLEESGVIHERMIGVDIDVATDVRDSKSQSIGVGLGTYTGFFVIPTPFGPIPIPYGALNSAPSIAIENYNSISMVKVIHRYGILSKVRSMKNGSVMEAENLVWDKETGNVLLSSSQNEFDDKMYSFNYPAYMAEGHEGMQGSYKNQGIGMQLTSNATTGEISTTTENLPYLKYFVDGDEVRDAIGDQKGWIFRADGKLFMINEQGQIIKPNSHFWIFRSGKRNLTTVAAGNIVMLKDPRAVINGIMQIKIDASNKIINADATIYKDEWGVPLPGKLETVSMVKADKMPTCVLPLIFGSLIYFPPNSNSLPPQRALNHPSTSNVTLLDIFTAYNPAKPCMNFGGSTTNLYYKNGVSMSGSMYTINPGETARAGDYTIVYDEISTNFINLMNTKDFPTTMRERLNNQNLSDFVYTVVPEYMIKNSNLTSLADWANRPILLLRRSGSGCAPYDWTSTSSCPVETLLKFRIVPPPNFMENVTMCVEPIDKLLNPYYAGVLGNWRADKTFAYSTDRVQNNGLPYLAGGTDIRNSGHYSSFDPFWTFSSTSMHSQVPNSIEQTGQKWLWTNQSIYFDRKGNGLEVATPRVNTENLEPAYIEDPKRIYNSMLYGFKDALPIANAINARKNEIVYDGFEDYIQSTEDQLIPCEVHKHFDLGIIKTNNNTFCAQGACISQEKAHSGKYSLQLTGAISVTKNTGSTMPSNEIVSKSTAGFFLQNNELAKGFSPVSEKRYILSCWINDNQPASNKLHGASIRINGMNTGVESMVLPVVEGWKRVELEFLVSSQFKLEISNTSGNIFIDDLRIYPANAQMTTSVYNDQNYRLMAQLDENNFATFFEYDAEGTPIRVKKETERGIMTLKESRQHIRKRPTP